MVWRHDQVASALSLVVARLSDVTERKVPRVDERAQQRCVLGRRNVDDHRPVLQVDEEHRVVRRRVRRRGLILPVRGTRPVQDVVVLGPGVAEVRLAHRIEVDERHPPQCRLDRTPVQHASLHLRRCEITARCELLEYVIMLIADLPWTNRFRASPA